ncbi:YhgE/Pip domain-containing protein [Bacillus sp. REN3]|uniref:YhgE/Pip domain-containing protein n=1 Tax=Bacillus sp. REN3 TaxID=2802440 RepID=UPI001AEE4655|nr:YhgE/Pip domain-containing protein [Bacillus sp. REN3]
MKKTLLSKELHSIFRNKSLLIPVLAVLFIPVLYTGMFLWAFWDPYDRLGDLPVAVVNEDSGAELDGERIELGDELTEKLKESKDFGFEFVSEKEGKKGLQDQKYYMLIKIPENFSENATTLLDEQPQKLELIYMPNESFNFLSAQIGETAVEKIKASVSEKVSETYAETMFDKIGELSDGLAKASEGASELTEGAGELKNGSGELYQNLAVLAGKSVEFNDGMKSANTGIKEVASGAGALSEGLGKLEEGHGKLASSSEELLAGEKELSAGAARLNAGLQEASSKMPALESGTAEIKQGSEQLANNLALWKQGADQTASGAAELHAGIQELQAKMQAMQPLLSAYPEQQKQLAEALGKLEAGSSQLAEGTNSLSKSAGPLAGGATQLAGGLDQLAAGQAQLHKGLDALSAGSAQLEEGTNKLVSGQQQFNAGLGTFGQKLGEASAGSKKLADGSAKLSGGMDQLSAGSSAMADGAGKLTNGAGKLAEGNEKVAEGTSELAGKLEDGAEKAKIDPSDDAYNMLAAPVKLDNEKMNEVPNYGTGFAPYFLSLGLFVGALLLSIVFPLREPAGVPASGTSWFASKFLILASIGILQALIADAIMLAGLGIEVESVPLFILFSIVTSLTFITLIQFLVTLFGDPGRFMAILILILQLTTSAGTFPLELIPGILQKFNAFLPMTYSVQGYKAVISSGDISFMWYNAAILGGFIAFLSIGTWLYFILMHKKKYSAAAEA